MNENTKNNKYITIFASLGSALEYYDFIIYGMMATYLSTVFFPSHNPASAVLQTFIVFAVGYFARPLGGTLMGIIGDRYGRRPAFLTSTILMAFSTLFISLLPDYETMGVPAVLLLVLFRIMQGLSFGGELPGAMTIVAEFSPRHLQGRKTSLVMAGTGLGALLASGALYLLSTLLSQEQIISWGWRLPFMGGGMFGLLILIARSRMQETPIFRSIMERAKKNEPMILLFETHKFSLMRGAALSTFFASLVITNLYFPYYVPKFFEYQVSDVYFGTTISLIFVILVLPLMGMISDYFPKRVTTLRGTCASYMVLSIPIFALLKTGNILALVAFLMIQQLYIALFASSLFPSLTRLFITEVRYTGIAICYNFTWAVMATIPMAYTSLLNAYDTPWIIPALLSGFAGLSFLGTLGILENLPERVSNENTDSRLKQDRVG